MSDKVLGKILEVNGSYVLQTSGVGKKVETLQVGPAAEKDKYAQLVGKEVEVVLSEPVRSVVAIIGKQVLPSIRCVIIMCYKPVSDLIPTIDPKIIAPMIEQFEREGIISKANANKLREQASRPM